MSAPAEPVSAIRNIGPKMTELFAKAGIYEAATIRDLGADAAYGRIIAAGVRPHFLAYCALVLGLQDRDVFSLSAEEKAALRPRFDALKSQPLPEGGPDWAELERLGIRP